MKILLSTPPGKTTELWPPLGLLYLASSVRSQRKDDIKVIDAFCENLTPEALLERVVKEKPDVFGLNCSTHTFMEAIEMLRRMREALPGTKLILGGYHATFASSRIINDYPFIDYILKGEGERSFPQLLKCIEDGESPSGVSGICYQDNGSLVENPFTLIDDLDSLPFPARELVSDLDYGYTYQGVKLTFDRFTTMCTSRGCPFKCTYCSCAELSLRKWRPRSAENVVDELESVYNDGYKCCVMIDDNFTNRRKRVEDICRMIRERRIKMQLYCEGRVDGVPYELLKTMKRSGFNVIYFGTESASQHVLDYYQKRIKPEEAITAIENAKRTGMLVITSYIIGAPVESKDDIKNTITMIKNTRPHGVQINILDCLVGTQIWNDLEKSKIVKRDDWKTNHRIYEYLKEGLPKDELEELAIQAYSAHIQGWKSKAGMKDLARLILHNKSARRIILGNIVNPDVRRILMEELRIEPVKSPMECKSDSPMAHD
jgi:anaerobic magnesium-protoporphyrin IX monomethyl ester cyclase